MIGADVAADQEFLLYPLDTGKAPSCPLCGQLMWLSSREARDDKPDFLTFRCGRCGRSEKFICEE